MVKTERTLETVEVRRDSEEGKGRKILFSIAHESEGLTVSKRML